MAPTLSLAILKLKQAQLVNARQRTPAEFNPPRDGDDHNAGAGTGNGLCVDADGTAHAYIIDPEARDECEASEARSLLEDLVAREDAEGKDMLAHLGTYRAAFFETPPSPSPCIRCFW